jgi:hypothetical protein
MIDEVALVLTMKRGVDFCKERGYGVSRI